MSFQTDSLHRDTETVCARDGVDLVRLPEEELLRLSDGVARVRRDADVLMALVAAEIHRRSDAADVGAGLASRRGFRSAQELVAQATGGSVAEAKRLLATGGLLAEADAVASRDRGGEAGVGPGGGADAAGEAAVPEPTPMGRFRGELAAAVRERQIGVDAAALFTGAMAGLPDVERTARLFSKALTKSPGLSLYQVRKLVWQAQAFADPKAWEEREERQHEARCVTVRDDTDGMVTLTARLTPLAAAPVKAVLDAGVRWALKARREDPDSDPRTPWQMRADILSDLCKHALDCTHATSGVKTTVVVRMNLADLQLGLGVGEIDGMTQPVSAGALRRAAADAEIIPVVLGGKSEILDWGRSRRLFTQAQRWALVERDGGCAWCNAPPSWCEAHHIRWWERDTGPTDLDNGVLMCSRCHHRIHRDGWDIEVLDHVVRFIPPRSIDPTQTPRIGGRHHYNLAA
ncbi:MAG: DUF222 domain-containing protein [Demequinaceae bacterium]|nr:DUF222 domain-containing protein [Demequinaceae bacterium]